LFINIYIKCAPPIMSKLCDFYNVELKQCIQCVICKSKMIQPISFKPFTVRIKCSMMHTLHVLWANLTILVTQLVSDLIRKNTWCEKKTRIGGGEAESFIHFLQFKVLQVH
jgi:hypothetical protein